MLWIINGLIYGFFTAVYMLFNQHYKINGYVLGIWRGFGICVFFLPFLFFFKMPHQWWYWLLLIVQGICIGIYDSHIFFASAKFGAGPTSRFMSTVVLITSFAWWALTPQKFYQLLQRSDILLTLILILCGFSFCYWQMLQSKISRQAAAYTMPAVLALAAMSIITKFIALKSNSLWMGLTYYLTVSTFISGVYNLCFFVRQFGVKNLHDVIKPPLPKIGFLLISFSSLLIIAKTMALRIAPNPGYVTALLLIAPLFIYALNKHYKISDKISLKAGLAMLFFLFLLVILITGNFGVDE